MNVNPLPPQAYTKETLQKAYAWLLNQSASVKDMATSQDILVSMYLKAQRSGDAALETPSIQNFKQELKSLASMIGDLQVPAPNKPNIPVAAHQQAPPPQPQAQSSHTPAVAPVNINSQTTLAHLDPSSIQAIQDVKQSLNLSSDTEALRALIALGHKHFRKIHS